MKPDLFLFSFLVSLAFLGVILYWIRSRKLREQYALLWLALSLVMMVLSLFPRLIDELALQLGIVYAPSLLYMVGLVAVLFILMHLTIAVSALTRKVITLTQTVALQEQRWQERRSGYDDSNVAPQHPSAGNRTGAVEDRA